MTDKKLERRNLRCELTEAEVDERARDLAEQELKAIELDQQRKDVAKELASELQNVRSHIARQATEVREKATYRDVECEWIKGSARLTFDLIRKDTGEVIQTRSMSEQERQRPILLEWRR